MLFACIVTMSGGAFVAAQSATAATGDPGLLLAFSEVRSGPNAIYALQFVTQYDAWIPLQCWTDTYDYPGSSIWHRWFKFNQVAEWVRSDRVTNQPSLPHC